VFYFSKIKKTFSTKFCLIAIGLGLTSCGDIPRVDPLPREYIQTIEPEEFWGGAEEEKEKYVDYADKSLSACEWHKNLERKYSSQTGRYRLLGGVGVRVPVAPPSQGGPFFLIKALVSLVDFFMPWNWFRGIENPPMTKVPWGRVDMIGNTLQSAALIENAKGQLPNREEFIVKAREAIGICKRDNSNKDNCGNLVKMLAFELGLATGMIDVMKMRDEAVVEEIEKSFPGLFSQNGSGDMLNSVAWLLIKNGINFRAGDNLRVEDLRTFTKPLPVFRKGGWEALSEDMQRGLSAAVQGLSSRSSSERACASNIVMRSVDQLIHLMGGVRTLPVYQSNNQSFVPAIHDIVKGQDRPVLKDCRAAGSLVRKNMRVVVTEKTLSNIASVKENYSWAPEPKAMIACRPDGDGWSSGYPSKSSTSLNDMLGRLEAFSHFLFAFSPNASWWVNSGYYPINDFGGVAEIQRDRALVPGDAHLLALGLMRLDFEHFMDRFLIYLDESGKRTLDESKAVGIRISTQSLNSNSTSATTELKEVLRLLNLVKKLDRYLAHLEYWKTSPRFSTWRMKQLFGNLDNLNTLLGVGQESTTRETIQKVYLGASLLMLKYIDLDEKGKCYSTVRTSLADDTEIISGDCGEDRKAFGGMLSFLAGKLDSAVLLRHSENIWPTED